ncbi:hypothetical protein ml_289 [Mollivirus sibericum]|uniref:hypothetical protein n=1 Tax=Mollivirus sibericum TaxID=1678078 RepID=UPI0006B2DD7A|nr:hypothetical protein ml_289 [Mollivirus sibericum]ALD62091.1 hypothetical protein ml_289 [Mollivirus sibericum]
MSVLQANAGSSMATRASKIEWLLAPSPWMSIVRPAQYTQDEGDEEEHNSPTVGVLVPIVEPTESMPVCEQVLGCLALLVIIAAFCYAIYHVASS